MRPSLAPLLVLAAAGALLSLAPARAQVSENDHALDALGPAPSRPAVHSPPRETRRAPEHHLPAARATRHEPPAHAAPHQAARAEPHAAPARPPVVALVPPAPAVLPPVVPEAPAHPPAPLPPVPAVADAPGAATPLPDGATRVTFGAGRADLNPGTAAALRALGAATVAAGPDAMLTITAHAAGTPDDPSTPRRLSLARALAVRAALMAGGMTSPHLILRAMGATEAPAGGPAQEEGPPDRVDVQRAAAPPRPVAVAAPGAATGRGGGGVAPAGTPTGAAPAAARAARP